MKSCRMQETRECEPRYERSSFNRIPCPETAPAQYKICPYTADRYSHSKEKPGKTSPLPAKFFPAVCFRKKVNNSSSKRYCHCCIANEHKRRMNDHPEI